MTSETALDKVKGPCVILAGAGTGKTFTIVEKIKQMISNNSYSPEKIVCITFSNEAANNLILRIGGILEDKKRSPIVRTFHGFSADLLRKYGEKIGIHKEFKILDPNQAMVILHRNLKVNAMNCQKYVSTIGTSKDLGITLDDFNSFLEKALLKYLGIDLEKRLENLNFDLQTLYLKKEAGWRKKELLSEIKMIRKILDIKKFLSVWKAYEKMKEKGNYQDYSDLNKNALALLEKFPEISSDFEYVIVDEFQDTNKLQLDFLFKLMPLKNITVVGDLNQSIYRFRGAYKENFKLFKEYFSVSDKDVFNLAKSYRSPNSVLRTSHKLISNNYLNKEECFFVENVTGKEGERIKVFELRDAKEEARKIVEIISEEFKRGIPLEDICVMFRAHQYGRIIKRALEQAGISYHSLSKAPLLKQKSVKTVCDYLVILNKLKKKEIGGEQAWWNLFYQLDFQHSDLIVLGKIIKNFSINSRLSRNSTEKEISKSSLLSTYLLNNMDKFELSVPGKISVKVLTDKIKLMLPFLEKPISQLLQEVYRISGLINGQKNKEEKEIMLNLNKFYEISKEHEDIYDSDLSNFLYYLDILGDLEIEIEAAQFEEKGVRLMTSHSTKGLEYNTVIITNLVQGRFPIERYTNNSLIPIEIIPEIREQIIGLNEDEKDSFVSNYEHHNQLLEERRLAYVSFTRAKENLILTFAGEYGGKKVFPSVFLNEISFRNNPDILFMQDVEQKYNEPEPELKKAIPFSNALSLDNFDSILEDIAKPAEKEHRRLSPSALLLFNECQKEFEYKYVYNMPERKTISWDAMRLGSFVHLVLERGVNSGFKNVDEFIQLAREINMDNEWESVEFDSAETLIRVFFERNKGKYNERSKTEQYLPLKLSGIDFMGFADRIDLSDNGIEIIDYKTGKAAISSKERDWQLGFYALAAQEKYGKVKKVVLDMLKQDKPLEFEIDDKGNALCVSSSRIEGFNIYDVRDDLVFSAKAIQEAYKNGFKPCQIEKNCEFCNEYIYGL